MWEPDYAQVEDLKAYLRIEDDVDDAVLLGVITAASRAIDQHCRRQFGVVEDPELRSYPLAWDRRGPSGTGTGINVAIEIDDLMVLDDVVVTVDGQEVTPASWLPRNGPQKGMPYTRVYLPASWAWARTQPDVQILAPWGWNMPPAAVGQAALLQSARLYKRRDAPFGVAGSPELGSELRLLAKVDPDVAVLLTKYVRPGRVA